MQLLSVEHFAMILLLTLWVLGFKAITSKGKLLHFVQRFFEQNNKEGKPMFSDFIKDPIVSCPTCMPSFHGLILYTIVSVYNGWTPDLIHYALIAVPCTFWTELLWKLKIKLVS
jgi:hypothetical protein